MMSHRPWTLVAQATAEQIDRHESGILAVYSDAFGVTDESVTERFRTNSLTRHRHYDGFRLDIALDDRDKVVGFTYGYRSAPGAWWHDRLAPDLLAAGRGAWLADAFEFVELAVAPDWHGNGIGGRLHDVSLAAAQHRRAVLSTDRGETPARAMYDRRGWTVLLEPFHYLPGDPGFTIMGLDLETWRASCGR